MKGIILAGGKGSRLYPATLSISKQLIPIYDKPMIYYPLAVLMFAKIKDILIISTPEHIDLYKNLLQDGSQFGLNISYKVQLEPDGIASAFILGEEFIGNDNVCLILGDNIFYGDSLKSSVKAASKMKEGAFIFGYHVHDPERYGVVEFDKSGKVLNIEEKPQNPKSHYAVSGLYFYDNEVINITKSLKPSARGEREITDVNKEYLKRNKLNVKLLGRGVAWLDTGTHESLYEASNFVATIEKRQGFKIACLEEIAYENNWIDEDQLIKEADKYKNTEYGQYLLSIVKNI